MIQIRQILVHNITQQRYRVVHIAGGDIWLMAMTKTAGACWPIKVTRDIAANEHTEVSDAPRALTMEQVQGAERIHLKFEAALEDVTLLLTQKGRVAAFDELVQLNPKIRPKQYYSVIRKWLIGGCIPHALARSAPLAKPQSMAISINDIKAMNFNKARQKALDKSRNLAALPYHPQQPTDHKKNGEPRKRSICERPTMYQVDQETLRLFLRFYKQHLKKPGSTLPGTYEQMCREIFTTETSEGEVKRIPDYAHPSFSQFEAWYYKLVNYKARGIADKGEKDWNLNRRSTLLQGVTHAYSAGVVGSLDATVWPVELISDDEHGALVGPPVVFRIRDRDNAMLLGLAVSLDSASWMSAASAIANCNECKVSFCDALGIKISDEDWPIKGLPAIIEADCGETHNKKPNAFISITKTDLKNIKAGRGDLKPGIEGDWAVIQLALCAMTPAAIIERYIEKTRNQWRIEASMTLKAFTKMLVLQELKKMHTIRPNLKLPAYMVNGGCDSSPISMWNWEINNRGGGLRAFNQESVKLSLLNIETGSVTENGLLFRGLLYISDFLEISFAYERARKMGRRNLQIAYDPRLVDVIYIIVGTPENPEKYIPSKLNTDRVDQRGLLGKSFREVQQIHQTLKRQNGAIKIERTQKIDAWSVQQAELVTTETKKVADIRKTQPISKTRLLSARAAAREHERNVTSPQFALTPSISAEKNVLATVASDNNVIALRQVERRKNSFAARAAALGLQNDESGKNDD
jgi:putative transposase